MANHVRDENGFINPVTAAQQAQWIIECALRKIDAPLPEGMEKTPDRFIKMLSELTAGYQTTDGEQVLRTVFEDDHINDYDGMVIVRDIPVHSLCEHHLAPFIGVCHIAYIPQGCVAGLSKFSRLVEIYARRFQVQERLTIQIATDIMDYLSPLGCAVIIEAMHTCMCMRGAKALGSTTTTSIMRGAFFDNASARIELLSLLNRK